MATLNYLYSRKSTLENKISNLKEAKKQFKTELRDVKGCYNKDKASLDKIDYWRGQTHYAFTQNADSLMREENQYKKHIENAIDAIDSEISSLKSDLRSVKTSISNKEREEARGE